MRVGGQGSELWVAGLGNSLLLYPLPMRFGHAPEPAIGVTVSEILIDCSLRILLSVSCGTRQEMDAARRSTYPVKM